MNPKNIKTKIVDLTAIELSKSIHAKEVSCVEVMNAYLDQIDAINPIVNAIVSIPPRDKLIEQATQADQVLSLGKSVGWMHGFPLAPKDLTATAGIPTVMGSPNLINNITSHDSIVVQRMKAAGAILIGKTNTPEFGLGSHTYNTVFGVTRNAYDQSKSAGGSSGGTAVALALNMLPVADGSDMGGSLRNPAAWNNIYGLRPSRGRVPFGPTGEVFFEQLGTEGPMGRNVPDLAMLLSVQAGYDKRAPLSLSDSPDQFSQSLARDFKGVRLGWMGDLGGHLPFDAGVLDLCKTSLKYFDQIGCQVEEVVPKFDFNKLWDCWLKLRAFLISGKLNIFYSNPDMRSKLKPEAIWEIEQGQSLKPAQVYAASEVRTAWAMEMNRLFETYDYLVMPTAQAFPFDAQEHWPKSVGGKAMDTYHRWMEVIIGPTLAGLPAISVPVGFSSEGLPMGIQLIGKPGADFEVLQLANAWQEATPFIQQKSSLLL
jgi:amidase